MLQFQNKIAVISMISLLSIESCNFQVIIVQPVLYFYFFYDIFWSREIWHLNLTIIEKRILECLVTSDRSTGDPERSDYIFDEVIGIWNAGPVGRKRTAFWFFFFFFFPVQPPPLNILGLSSRTLDHEGGLGWSTARFVERPAGGPFWAFWAKKKKIKKKS